MPRRSSSADVHRSSHADTEPFRIMVVYDDMNAGLGAQQYLDRIAGQIGDGHALDVRFWKEDILTEPHLWRQASADAAEVDLILFAMSTSLLLPTRILRWVQKWESSLTGQEVSYEVVGRLQNKDVHFIGRNHHARKLDFRRGIKIDANQRRQTWVKPRQQPRQSRLSAEQWEQLPDHLLGEIGLVGTLNCAFGTSRPPWAWNCCARKARPWWRRNC